MSLSKRQRSFLVVILVCLIGFSVFLGASWKLPLPFVQAQDGTGPYTTVSILQTSLNSTTTYSTTSVTTTYSTSTTNIKAE